VLLDGLPALLKSNPILAGGAGVAVAGWLMMQARAIPSMLWRLIRDQLSVSLTIYSENAIFNELNIWLSNQPSAKRARRLTIAEWFDESIQKSDRALTPGPGLHLFKAGWRFFLVNRAIEKGSGDSNSMSHGNVRRQSVTLTTLGRSSEPFVQLLQEVSAAKNNGSIPIYVWDGQFQYELIERKPKRSLDTIHLDEAVKAGLIQDVQTFQDARDSYVRKAIPYRRGYMFEGPPGTGKTSLIFALASLVDKPIYIINLNSIRNDLDLGRAISRAGPNVVALEDIDSLPASIDRAVQAAPSLLGEADSRGISQSGLLNALDGIGAKDGRILCITTNAPETLDPALIRPGRIDRRVHLGYIGMEAASEMFRRFFPDGDLTEFQANIESLLPISPANLQNRLLGESPG
jgi:chaperone BCS1